ncbi:cupin domain-containing protein [Kitasatospora brasiliensis]|uniref:cupin domain-containing protein n=1 Tax=Kitasatospora brasiliensis TaxID=3058040 RepID=UPI00292D8CDA|nr:cupin domain-containing protein [Kitasatospora sp. K002]
MLVISETEERTTRNPAGLAAGLAGPSQGSEQVSTWRVVMETGTDAPVHLIDRDQIWMPIAGTFEFVVGDETSLVKTGQAIVVPADVTRTFRAIDGQAQALVAMAPGGTAALPGNDARLPLPWAE